MSTSIYDIPVRSIRGEDTTLAPYRGKVMLIVNVASACGLTPQYEGLEKLYEAKQADGLVVAGFPANEFKAQEPGSNEEIYAFCTSKFGVKFPMFEKIVVKGEGQHPLYAQLTEAQPKALEAEGSAFRARLAGHGITQEKESDVLWNFEKFLVGRDGAVIGRFAPDTAPDDPVLTAAIDKALAA
jgi:glutathione peroxidase